MKRFLLNFGSGLRRILPLLPPILCLIYASFLAFLLFSGKIYLFIQANTVFYSWISMIVLFIIGFFQIIVLVRGWFRRTTSTASEKANFRLPSGFWFAAMPILLMFFLPLRPLSTSLASVKSATINDLGLSREVRAAPSFVINTENRGFLDWVQLFDQNPEPEQYNGLKAKLVGFVLPETDPSTSTFLLTRFVISCCVADARPVSIPVRYDPQKFSFKANEWVEVKGAFQVDEANGERKPILMLQSFQEISPPENPYLN